MNFRKFIRIYESESTPPQQSTPTKPNISTASPKINLNPQKELKPSAPSVRDGFSERTRDRLEGYEKKHDGRVNKALGGSPFEPANPTSDTYKRNAPRMKPYMDMNSDEKTALGMYGENVQKYHKQLNDRLRGKSQGSEDQETKGLIDYMHENLNSALNRISPSEPRGSTRFINGQESFAPGSFNRAVTGDFAKQLAEFNVGDELQDDGFGSFTENGGPALDQFLSNERDVDNAVIRLAEGSKLRNISPVTEYNEGEHISMPGSRFRVQSIDPKGHYSRKAGDVPLYILEMIEDLQDDGKLNNSNQDD